MSKVKMVLMLVLLLTTVMTTAATFMPTDTLVAKADCPGPNEWEGSCVTDESDANFSTCSGPGGQYGNYLMVCYEVSCAYQDPHGNTIYGSCCGGGSCYIDE